MFAFAGSRPVPRRRRNSREQRAHFGEAHAAQTIQRSDSKPVEAGEALVGSYHRCRAGAHIRLPHVCTTTITPDRSHLVRLGRMPDRLQDCLYWR